MAERSATNCYTARPCWIHRLGRLQHLPARTTARNRRRARAAVVGITITARRSPTAKIVSTIRSNASAIEDAGNHWRRSGAARFRAGRRCPGARARCKHSAPWSPPDFMSPAAWSLIALIALGAMTSRINVSWLGLAFAWVIGDVAGLQARRRDGRLSGVVFTSPASHALRDCRKRRQPPRLASRAVRLARSNARDSGSLLRGGVRSSIGPGAVSTVAARALAMIAGHQAGALPHGAHGGQWRQRRQSVAVFVCRRIANSAMAKAGLVATRNASVCELRGARDRRRPHLSGSRAPRDEAWARRSQVGPALGCRRVARRWRSSPLIAGVLVFNVSLGHVGLPRRRPFSSGRG